MKWLGAGLLCLFSLGYAAPAAAQSGGFKIGVNFADLSFDDDEGEQEFDTRTGLVVGGFVEAPITSTVSFQPEFLYSQKGAKFTDLGSDLTIKYDVVQIPLLLKLNVGGDASTRGFIVVGPGLGFKTTAKIEDEDGTELEDLDEEVESFDFTGIIGGGVQFGPALVEVRYDYGFRNLDKEDQADIKTRTFSILFGVGWGR